MSFTETVVYEAVERRDVVCNVGCTNRRALVVRRYVLAIVEQRPVPDLWSESYGQPRMTTGFRAVDQFGDEWTSSWEGPHSDGFGSRDWTTADGRKAESAPHDGTPAGGTTFGWIDADASTPEKEH